MPTFPSISDEQRKRALEPPGGPVRIVIDTDAANEIDDQYALAWALLSQDQLNIEGVYAVPYSFGVYRKRLLRTYDLIKANKDVPDMLKGFIGWVKNLQSLGKKPEDVHFCTPSEGMEESYQEILTVYDKLGLSPDHSTLRGSPRYITSYDEPVKSEAAEHLIECALASDEPLYVVAIGATTNIASALLLAPEIVSRIVVTWTAGYPSHTNIFNHSFNLVQDILGSQLLFDSGVPMVYLPGFYLGAQLRLSLPEVESYVKGRGGIGDYLHYLYTHNPIYEQRGIQGHFGRSWVIWDLINFAWLMNPDWVPSRLVPTPTLGSDQYWHLDGRNNYPMREAFEIDRDGIFRDFFTKLNRAATGK